MDNSYLPTSQAHCILLWLCSHLVHVVVRGLIDIVVVLMSTSSTHMLARAGSILTCASMRLGCQCKSLRIYDGLYNFHTTWQVEISAALSGIDNKPTIKKEILTLYTSNLSMMLSKQVYRSLSSAITCEREHYVD